MTDKEYLMIRNSIRLKFSAGKVIRIVLTVFTIIFIIFGVGLALTTSQLPATCETDIIRDIIAIFTIIAIIFGVAAIAQFLHIGEKEAAMIEELDRCHEKSETIKVALREPLLSKLVDL